LKTECTKVDAGFQPLGRREIRADFNVGTIISGGGALLLGEVEQRTGILQRFSQCFIEHRKQNRIVNMMFCPWSLNTLNIDVQI